MWCGVNGQGNFLTLTSSPWVVDSLNSFASCLDIDKYNCNVDIPGHKTPAGGPLSQTWQLSNIDFCYLTVFEGKYGGGKNIHETPAKKGILENI